MARGHVAYPSPMPGILVFGSCLLHTFAHAVIRQLSIECGYTTASIRERIYCQSPDEGEPMAGVLVYTAAADSGGRSAGYVHWAGPTALAITWTGRWR